MGRLNEGPTTPTPTLASVVLGMEEALRDIADGLYAHEPADTARAALAAWEQRPRLRFSMTALVYGLLAEHDDEQRRATATFGERVAMRQASAGRILDAIEAHLFGTGPRGAEAGNERGHNCRLDGCCELCQSGGHGRCNDPSCRCQCEGPRLLAERAAPHPGPEQGEGGGRG
jgi:hypothetical protein